LSPEPGGASPADAERDSFKGFAAMNEQRPAVGFDSGSSTIDDEHNLQVSLLFAFRRAAIEGLAKDEAAELLDRFVDFTKVHFASEEMLMRLYQYPQLAAHAEDHQQTLEQLADIRAAWLTGKAEAAADYTQRLVDWTLQHIESADKAFGRYLLRLGIGPG
jgi:hemerythrin